jgi:hypothetical protein
MKTVKGADSPALVEHINLNVKKTSLTLPSHLPVIIKSIAKRSWASLPMITTKRANSPAPVERISLSVKKTGVVGVNLVLLSRLPVIVILLVIATQWTNSPAPVERISLSIKKTGVVGVNLVLLSRLPVIVILLVIATQWTNSPAPVERISLSVKKTMASPLVVMMKGANSAARVERISLIKKTSLAGVNSVLLRRLPVIMMMIVTSIAKHSLSSLPVIMTVTLNQMTPATLIKKHLPLPVHDKVSRVSDRDHTTQDSVGIGTWNNT